LPTFVHLHVHSDGSLQDGISSVKRIVEKTKALGMPAVSITDHGRAGSLLDFYKTCRKNEIKPLLGLEAYVAPRSHTLKEPIDGFSTSYHLTLLAKNATGLKNIFRLTSLGWLEGFYYRPRVSTELLKQYREGLIVLSGCGSGYISKMFLDRQDKEAYEHAKLLREIYKDDFYVEIQDHGIDWQAPLKEKLIHLSNQMSIPAIATQDSHFIEHDEYLLHQKVCRLTASDLEFSTTETYFKSYDEMLVRFGQTPELLHRTAEVAEKCNVEWDYGRTIWPVYPLEKTTPDEELERLATEGFHKLFGEGTEVYKERFRYELAVIKKMGFSTYFLVVQDLINWAKDNKIPTGPGRGCLVGGTPVFLADGRTKKLAEIEIGDKIINKDGRPGTVTKVFEYPVEEELVRLETFYGDFEGIILTKDHLVFGEKTKHVENYFKWSKTTQKSQKKYKPLSWEIEEIKADNLNVGDWVLFPKIEISPILPPEKIDLAPYISLNRYDCSIEQNLIIEYVPNNEPFIGSVHDIHRQTKISRGAIKHFRDNQDPERKNTRQEEARKTVKKYILSKFSSLEEWRQNSFRNKTKEVSVSRYINLDEEFFWILGKWAADGWLQKRSDRTWGICFNSENEILQAERVKRWLRANNLNFEEYPHAINKLLQIEVHSGLFCHWWSNLFPDYRYTSQTKAFPRFVSSLPEKHLKSVLTGYIEGDAGEEQGRIKITTTSRKLAHQTKFNLLRLGIPSSIRFEEREDSRENFPDETESYHLNIPIVDFLAELYPSHATIKRYNWERRDGQILCKIRSKKYIKDIKKVYDISIDNDPSYLTSSGVVHNSGAGSLICYCLGITGVDPIKYGLYFDRFLNSERISLPDLDLDMCPRGRKQVLQYVMSKYGEDRVCQIGTYGAFKPRGSLRDFARVCGYPPSVGAELAKLIPPDVAGKALTFDEAVHAEPKLLTTGYPEVVDFARKAEGLRTKAGVHAAGIVIADRPLTDILPLFKGKSDETATQFDMHDVEELGLVKYDFLGLINLTIIDDTIKLIEKTKRIRIDINNIDREDQAVYENIFQKGELDGVFQFETSSGFKDLCVRVKPSSIEDLSAITSIFRPGPIGAGLLEQYIARRNGTAFEYLDPRLEPVLKETLGVYCYQEQVMRICTDLAGYTAAQADDMRKAIGKKIADKMKEHQKLFVNGCKANGIDEEVATKLFTDIDGYSKYAFNKAHAVAYSIISFATAWLKHYYKEEFYCSLFNNTLGQQDQLVKYIYSCRQQGIPIQPPDINKSYAEFTLDNGTIIFGLAGVKGIGEKACQQFLEKRPEDGIQNLDDLFSLGMNQGILKSLARCGALEGISEIPSSQLEEAIETLATYYKKLATWEERKIRCETREEERQSCIDTGEPPPKRLPKLPNRPEFPAITEIRKISRAEKLALEHDTLGFYLTGHPLDDYPSLTRMASCTIEEIIEDSKGGEVVTIPAVVSILERRRTRKGQDMANIILEDRTGRIEATIFPKTWVKVKDTFDVGQIVITSCKIDREVPFEEGATTVAKLYLQTISPIKNEDYIMAEMSNLKMDLHDGSSVWFITDKETDFNKWQKAKALIQNLE